jgi:hypothetical protein
MSGVNCAVNGIEIRVECHRRLSVDRASRKSAEPISRTDSSSQGTNLLDIEQFIEVVESVPSDGFFELEPAIHRASLPCSDVNVIV